jgi:hypothetical protein
MSDTSTSTRTEAGTEAGTGTGTEDAVRAARQRLALRQTALLSALVAGTPVPEGFDRGRVAVQSRALIAKRADVIAKVAPELTGILGPRYRPAFVAYATRHPLTGGYRQDAVAFAGHLLAGGAARTGGAEQRRRLADWHRERTRREGAGHRLLRGVRGLLGRRR